MKKPEKCVWCTFEVVEGGYVGINNLSFCNPICAIKHEEDVEDKK